MKIAAAVLLVFSLLQRGGPPPPAVPDEPATVDGVVVESGSGRPMQGVTVLLQIRTGAAMVTSTRSDGTFFFRNVPPGIYSIQADRGGYIPELSGTTPFPFGPAQQLAPGQKLTGVRLALTRGAVISGRLIDDRGELVVGALVQALKTTYKNGLRERTVVQSSVSNDLGEYRLFMLRPGEYHINVGPGVASLLPQRLDSLPFYFPGTIDAKAAQAIVLREGETLDGVNFSSIPTRTRQVTGSVQGHGGDPVGVVLSPLNSPIPIQQTLDPKNPVFQFSDVAPGSYTLVARTAEVRSSIPLDVRNADMINMRIVLNPGFRIPAHVQIDGHPPGDDPELDKVYLVFRAERPIPGLEPETYSPFANGRLSLEAFADDYRIDIKEPEGAYIKSATLAGVDVLNQGLHVTGSTDQVLEIVIASATGSVEGRAAGANATVVLVPDAARRGQRTLYQSIKPGSGGEFRFPKVPPGDYKLFAFTEENGGPWLDPEYLRKYEDRGAAVHIDAGKRTLLDRALTPLE